MSAWHLCIAQCVKIQVWGQQYGLVLVVTLDTSTSTSTGLVLVVTLDTSTSTSTGLVLVLVLD